MYVATKQKKEQIENTVPTHKRIQLLDLTCHITCWTLSIYRVQFFHGVFDISTGTEPRQGHRRDQENDGDVQREEGRSFINT